jgi:hypothetical protein
MMRIAVPNTPIPRVLENESDSAEQTTKARIAEIIV